MARCTRSETMENKPKFTVLVVNDEPSIRKYLKTLLEVDGFDVSTVSSGKEALTKIDAGERPDCILLDVLMPEMGGIETLHEMMHLDRRLNIVMTSCSSSFGTIIEAFRLGARDYLVFPFENAELISAILSPRRKRREQILSSAYVAREVSPWSFGEIPRWREQQSQRPSIVI